MNKVYIGIYPDSATNKNLYKYAEECEFDTKTGYNGKGKFDFHLTIIVSKKPCGVPRSEQFLSRSIRLTPKKIDFIGETEIPVLFLKDDDRRLEGMRYIFEKTYKIEGDYQLLPHMSLSYNWKGGDLKSMKLPTFPIVFDKIKIQDALIQEENGFLTNFKNFFFG